MSSLHYFANRYRNRVSRKREFFNLYKTVFVILNMQKSHKISLFKILQLFYHVASQTSSIFTCNTCTKSRGLFSGYFSAAYAFRTLILLTFGRSFQRVPWQMNKIFVIAYISLQKPPSLDISGLWALLSFLLSCRKPTQISVTLHRFSGKWCSNWCSDCDCFNLIFSAAPVRQAL